MRATVKHILLKSVAIIFVFTFLLSAFASCNNENPNDPETPSVNEDLDNTGNEKEPDDNDGENIDSDGNEGEDDNQGGEVLPQDIVYSLDGKDGKSGYQLAVESGFKGTVDEWLDHFSDTEDADNAEELRELLTTKHQLRVNEDGSFKVLVFSDVQSKNSRINTETVENIRVVCEREKPDFVIFNGDNSYGINNKRSMEIYVAVMSKWCENNGVPWAHVYGNHDDETNNYYRAITKEEQQEIYESFEYCVSEAGDPKIAGLSNYVLPVYTYDGTKIAFNIWGLDSGGYAEKPTNNININGNYFHGGYEGMKTDQVNWYFKTSKRLEKYNGELVPGMMTFHIPPQETYTAWSQKEALGLEWTGEKREGVNACAKNCGLFDKVVQRGDVKIIVNSHDHINDFMVEYKDVKLCYTACIGTEQYHALDMLGGRVVNFSTQEPTEFETYMSYVREISESEEKPPVDNETQILQLKIEDNGTVSNVADSGVEIVSKDYTGSKKAVSKDSEINKNVITFAGNTDKPSVYNMAAASFIDTLADGFSYEVMFKITDNTFSSNYVGVLDFEESGGFGLDIYKSSDSSKAVIYAELAYAASWSSLKYTIDLNKWYHVVFSYDGTNVVLYVNGVEVAKDSLNGKFRAPSFSSRAGEEYICIGACAQAWHGNAKSTGISGMTGAIAIANIYAKPLTATEAISLYKAAK